MQQIFSKFCCDFIGISSGNKSTTIAAGDCVVVVIFGFQLLVKNAFRLRFYFVHEYVQKHQICLRVISLKDLLQSIQKRLNILENRYSLNFVITGALWPLLKMEFLGIKGPEVKIEPHWVFVKNERN